MQGEQCYDLPTVLAPACHIPYAWGVAKDELLLIDAAAERGIPRRTLYHAAERGDLKARQLGKTRKIWVTTLKAVDDWIANGNHQRGKPRKSPR